MVVDFDSKALLGSTLSDVTKPSIRKLIISHPQRVTNYVTDLQDYFTRHNIPQKVERLQEQMEHNKQATNDHIRQYEALSKSIMQGQLSAENKCTKHKGPHPWSLVLATSGKDFLFWKKVLRYTT